MPCRPTALRLVPLCLLLALGGCSSLNRLLEGEKVDYRTGGSKQVRLEIPPDLTQLQKDSRYQPVDGTISASSLQGSPVAVGNVAAGQIAPSEVGSLRLMREGNQRWLVTPLTPEQMWPILQQFWEERGFTMETEQRELGVMQTNWAENRTKLPQDFIRRTLGGLIENLYDTGERDAYRTRIERTPQGSEIYISHRGAVEVYVTSPAQGQTAWQMRPSDPDLEAAMLSRLMIKLGATEEQAKVQGQTLGANAKAPARARVVGGQLELDEPLDRAWRRVGLALDRSGFTVEDRDRSQGLYFVRYINPADPKPKDGGVLRRIFGGFGGKAAEPGPTRYRIALAGGGEGGRTVLRVLQADGKPSEGQGGGRIVELLANELK